jgi:1,4-dihydroxy-2-naphthoyl-CoA synthase
MSAASAKRRWQRSGPEPGQEYSGIWCGTAAGVAKITISRPEVRNAFRPATVTGSAAGMRQFAGDATGLCFMSEQAQAGRGADKEKRTPDLAKFSRRP